MFRPKIPFRNKIIIVAVIYISIASLFAAFIPILRADRVYDIFTTKKNYNNTVINITRYETIAGTCTVCFGGSILSPPGCYDSSGYSAYAVVSYAVWDDEGPVTYKGATENDIWCGATPSIAINAAENQYGPVGTTYNGYYLLTNHYDWYFYLPGHYLYLAFLIGTSTSCALTIMFMFIHLGCMYYKRRRQGYIPITTLIGESN